MEPDPGQTDRDPDQAWFWTPEWQADEREADADLVAGRSVIIPAELFETATVAELDKYMRRAFAEMEARSGTMSGRVARYHTGPYGPTA